MGCDLRLDLVGCVDEARGIIDDLGLRVESVSIQTVEWAGDVAADLPDSFQAGLGQSTQLTLLEILPGPIVSVPRPRRIAADPGTYEDGDRIISKITRTLTELELGQPADGPSGEKRERFFLIDGKPYRRVRELEKDNFEWIIHVRRVRDRPSPDVVIP